MLRLVPVALAVATCVAWPAKAVVFRDFGAAISPTTAAAGGSVSFSVEIINCNNTGICLGYTTSHNQDIGSATVQVPAGFTVAPATLSVSPTGSKAWSVSLVGSTIVLGAVNGTQKLARGESLTLTFTTTAPCTAGSYLWAVAAHQDLLNAETPYTQVTSPLSVVVTGSCVAEEFKTGDYCSVSQGGWGAPPNGDNRGQTLALNFDLVSPLVVGVGYTMTFSSADAVEAYLPAKGTPLALTTSYSDPTSTGAGVFGGQVLALQLNAGLQRVIQGIKGSIGPLKLRNTGTSLDGKTVGEILAAAQVALGGGAIPTGYTISDLNNLITNLNEAFDACVPTQWAKDHLTP